MVHILVYQKSNFYIMHGSCFKQIKLWYQHSFEWGRESIKADYKQFATYTSESVTAHKLSTMSTAVSVSDQKALMRGYFHSRLINILLLGTFFFIASGADLVDSILHLIGMYTPLYISTMYIYSKTIPSSAIVCTKMILHVLI